MQISRIEEEQGRNICDNIEERDKLNENDNINELSFEYNNKLNDENNIRDRENNDVEEEDNKLIKNEKRNFIIFSSILRYKRYLVKKGNTYFDFNQTNLQLNEKELLLQSSNFYHLFDSKSLFCPHIYLNVYSHININISDYLNYLKKYSNVNVESQEEKSGNYYSRQEFILEAIERVEHIEM